MDADALIVVGFALVYGFVSWRWSIPYQESIYRMVHNKNPEPGSFTYRSLRFNRWFGVAFSVLIVVLVVLGS